jgi:hypothetical protein
MRKSKDRKQYWDEGQELQSNGERKTMHCNKKKNRKEKKNKGMLEGIKTSKLYTLNNSTGCYIIHQTQTCNTENTNKHMLASCTHNMQYFDGCHPVMTSV